ncbi:FIG00641434: hypothetical protein [Escherichia coli IS1]|nr:FIG00641434: hypothetical protein [Escherichia coli IS1]
MAGEGKPAWQRSANNGLTDASGQVVFETRLKPTVAIGAQAAAVHGISE